MTEIFPDEDYRFNFRFERGSFAAFFGPTPAHEQILAERRRWLQAGPQTYSALLPDGIPLMEATIELGQTEQVLPKDSPPPQSINPSSHQSNPPIPFLHHSTNLPR